MTSIGSVCYRATALTLWGLVILLVASLVGAGRTAGQEAHRAGLVIDFGGQVETSCVEFSEDEISGSDLLRRSGLAVVFSDFGGGLGEGVCQIGDTGCSNPGDCFCQCQGADCAYWVYFALVDGAWQFQQVGPSTRRVRHGDVDAWRWGSPQDEPPPVVSFAEVCPLPAEPPPPSDDPTDSPLGPQSPGGGPDGAGGPAQGPSSRGPPEQPGSSNPEPGQQSGEDAETARGPKTPPATPGARQAAGRVERADTDDESAQASEREAQLDDESGDGAPVGLIAFGAVAGALALAVAGLALRRRFGG